jgi:hypothetical protein
MQPWGGAEPAGSQFHPLENSTNRPKTICVFDFRDSKKPPRRRPAWFRTEVLSAIASDQPSPHNATLHQSHRHQACCDLSADFDRCKCIPERVFRPLRMPAEPRPDAFRIFGDRLHDRVPCFMLFRPTFDLIRSQTPSDDFRAATVRPNAVRRCSRTLTVLTLAL